MSRSPPNRPGGALMEPFAFHAELFELRNVVLEMLADHGFA